MAKIWTAQNEIIARCQTKTWYVQSCPLESTLFPLRIWPEVRKPCRLRGYRRRFCPLPSLIGNSFWSLSEKFFQKALDKIAKLVYNTSNRKSEIARTVRCLHRVIPQVTDRSPPPSWDRSARQSGKYASQLRKCDKHCLYGHFAASAALKPMPELWANCAFAKNSQNRI